GVSSGGGRTRKRELRKDESGVFVGVGRRAYVSAFTLQTPAKRTNAPRTSLVLDRRAGAGAPLFDVLDGSTTARAQERVDLIHDLVGVPLFEAGQDAGQYVEHGQQEGLGVGLLDEDLAEHLAEGLLVRAPVFHVRCMRFLWNRLN